MQEPAWVGGVGSQAADKVANNLAYLSVYDGAPPTAALNDPYKAAGRPDANGWLGPVPAAGGAQGSPPAAPPSPGPAHRVLQQGGPLSVGWGGQAIPDSPGFRVPWFGRSRGKGSFPPRSRGRGRSGGLEQRGRRSMRRAWNAVDEGLREEEGLSVEEVVSLIQGLPQGQHIPEAAYQSLFQFDSRATALLLKDLSKAGLGHRAVELFDWLRKLDEAHPLHALCDVYTYTAMISMCIYQQVSLFHRRSLHILGMCTATGPQGLATWH